MYRTILLAYDGSRQGREALDQGAELASLCQARVYLLAVVAHELGVALAEAAAPSDLPEREYQEVRRVLTEGAESLRRAGPPTSAGKLPERFMLLVALGAKGLFVTSEIACPLAEST